MIVTARLTLVPATVALARAELGDRAEFARLLAASIPENWPPESAADAVPLFLNWLEAAPDLSGWFSWYALAQIGEDESCVLVGSGGFMGPPQSGELRMGYSLLPEFPGAWLCDRDGARVGRLGTRPTGRKRHHRRDGRGE